MCSHSVQAEAYLVIPSQFQDVCAICLLNFIQSRVQGSTPIMIWVKMNVKPLPCPFVHNFCNSFITQSRAPPLVACNTQLYYCSICKAFFVSFLKKFFDTLEGSLFLNLSVTIESNNSCTAPDVCTCPTLCNIGWTNFRALLDYSAHFLTALSLKESSFHYLPS